MRVKPSLDWLLVLAPAAIALHWFLPGADTAVFIVSCLAIVPLAGWLGEATEQIASRTSEGIGGLLNATFGNASELIISLAALHSGLYAVVKASLTGSIIGNILLVFGGSALAGGLKYKVQRFSPAGARIRSTMLLLAAIAFIVPAAYHYLGGLAGRASENDLSTEISVVLLIAYSLGLLFSLRTHHRVFQPENDSGTPEEEPHWSMRRSALTLAAATAGIAWVSEILVGSVEHAAQAFGMTRTFIGVIIVAIVGNAAEHSTAVRVALKNRMELSFSIAAGSSIQIALFVGPVLVLFSHFIGPRPMNLVFSPAEVLAIGLSALITTQIAADGETNWLEGVLLLAVYVILVLVFFFLPEAAA